ncbi:Nif3-like dinuclear metal center hexameric protein [Meiothermus sp. QL-1]|uniref:Nif3-like dinuclear metal center hexameric protein n=1 Tax=Meiothermus sp. QL-1 TaxID=2058095 RepID=UPI000E0B584E|nr:Nif3-like dinuclear metal center hexameric protein [Meiothermus sp. QL-1]RDI96287.1 Nif3-like dinuclear metal center hexameric protein [Meiothermus sp. QL-1]
MQRDALVRWLNEYLQIGAFKDPSLNGLQVEGKAEVRRLGVAVDAALAVFEKARAAQVDFLITHHGLFWGQPLAVVGPHKKRLEALLKSGINLYTAHLPLDAHPEVGNNAVIAQKLGLTALAPLPHPRYGNIGWVGRLPAARSLGELERLLEALTGTPPLVHAGGPERVEWVGIVSGGGAGEMAQARALGCELYITGEASHAHYHDPFELGLNVFYLGHYQSETFGVKALAERLSAEFGLPWVFLEHPTGL